MTPREVPVPNGTATPSPPTAAAVSFVTTEHFTLQGARSATVAESTARAGMFLSSVSAGLIALGLIATASGAGTAFASVGLVLLPTLALIGLVTFGRVLQTGIEDLGYARRIARLRAYYFDNAPELVNYLFSTEPAERLHILGLWAGRWQGFRTVAGMVAAITSVLTGSAAALLAGLLSHDSIPVAVATGVVVALTAEYALMRYQLAAWAHSDRSAGNSDAGGS